MRSLSTASNTFFVRICDAGKFTPNSFNPLDKTLVAFQWKYPVAIFMLCRVSQFYGKIFHFMFFFSIISACFTLTIRCELLWHFCISSASSSPFSSCDWYFKFSFLTFLCFAGERMTRIELSINFPSTIKLYNFNCTNETTASSFDSFPRSQT